MSFDFTTVESVGAIREEMYHLVGALASRSFTPADLDRAAVLLATLMTEVEGPTGFPTWKAAAIYERLKRVNLDLEEQ